MRFAFRFVILLALVSMNGIAQTKPSDDSAPQTNPKLQAMPQALEIRWELSAIPAHLRDAAAAYVLDPDKGYVVARQGTNGVSCIVVRSDWQWSKVPFRDDIYWPVCYDSEGSKTHLLPYLAAAELRAKGMNSRQVHEEIIKRYDTGVYHQPARTGISYMISPLMRGYPAESDLAVPVTNHLPHYMVYAPNVSDADIGGKSYSLYPFMLRMSPGHDDVIIFLVGEAEKAKILEESKDLLADLCSYREYFCNTKGAPAHH